MFYFCKYFLSKFLSQISSLLVCRFFARLHIHHCSIILGFVKGHSIHQHSAGAGEVGGGEEVALASADDEVVAHLELLVLVEGEESVVDGGCVCGWIEVGQHLALSASEISLMRYSVPLACLAFFSGYGSSGLLPVNTRQIAFFLEAHFVGRSFCFHRLFLLGLWLIPAFSYGKRTSCGGSGVGTWSSVSHFTPSPTTTGCPDSHVMRARLRCFPKGVPASLTQ